MVALVHRRELCRAARRIPHVAVLRAMPRMRSLGSGCGARLGGRPLLPRNNVCVPPRELGHGFMGLMPGVGGGRFAVERQRLQSRMRERCHCTIGVGGVARMGRNLGQGDPGTEQDQAEGLPEWEGG